MSGLTNLFSLTSLPQKLMLAGASVALVAAVGWNVMQLVDNRHLTRNNEALSARIEDPRTGYIVKLTQAQGNAIVCKAAIEQRNTKIRDQSIRAAATVAAVQARYDVEHLARTRAESSAAAFLAQKPTGDTVEERINDVDKQILGDLK